MRRTTLLALLLSLAVAATSWAATVTTVVEHDCPTPISGPTSDYPLDNN